MINSLSGSGGAEQGLVREITRFSADVTQKVVRLYDVADLEPHLAKAGIDSECLDLDSGNSGWNWPAGIRRLDEVVRRFRPDVIQSSLASANLIAQSSGARAGVPVLSTLTLSGDPALMRQYQPGASSLPARVLRKIEQRSARRPHVRFRALTEDSRDTYCAAGRIPTGRVSVIPRGVPMPSGPTPAREELGLPTDRPVILNVGRQTAQKGHRDLVRAFAAIVRDRPAHLVILGREGDGTPALRQEIERTGTNDMITVVPYTDRPYDYYRNADLMAFPSRMEGLGTAVLEAMACELPVVAYDIPPIREIGSDLAALVEPGDVTALIRAVGDVLDDPAAARSRASLALEHVRTTFSVEAVAGRVETLLGAVAAGGTAALDSH